MEKLHPVQLPASPGREERVGFDPLGRSGGEETAVRSLRPAERQTKLYVGPGWDLAALWQTLQQLTLAIVGNGPGTKSSAARGPAHQRPTVPQLLEETVRARGQTVLA